MVPLRAALQRDGFFRTTPRGDLVAAVGLLAWLVVYGRGVETSLTLAVVAVALLWRTRAPWLAVFGVSVGALLGNVLTPDVPQCGVVLPALMFVTFSVASHREAREALFAAGVLGVVMIVQSLIDPRLSFGYSAFLLPMLAGIWVAGRATRSHRSLSRELDRRTRELALRRDERAAAAVAVERARVGGELHDLVTVGVGEIVSRARIGRGWLSGDPEAAREALETIEFSGRAVLNEMRVLLGVLRTADSGLVLAPQPGLSALDDLVAGARARGTEVQLVSHGTAGNLTLGMEISAYRIVENALEAALEHSPGSAVSVRVRYSQRDVELQIISAGAEASRERATADDLLPSRERIALYGGAMHAGVQADGTYALRARLPLRAVHG